MIRKIFYCGLLVLVAILLYSGPATVRGSDWWDKFGEPKYGGTLTVREASLDSVSFDPAAPMGGELAVFYEGLFMHDWTVDREIWPFRTGYVPTDYMVGMLAESWEKTGPQTIVVHLKKGIKWQDKPPVNGREFTSADVVYTFDRALGTGSGFTERHPFLSSGFSTIDHVVALDDYTVEFRLNTQSAVAIEQVVAGGAIIAREWYEKGDLQNWRNAVGTGPWIVSDYVVGSSFVFDKNPDYWGIDERHPENKIPYIDKVKHIAIPDAATTMAALRTHQVDMIVTYQGTLHWRQVKSLTETNPEINVSWKEMPSYAMDFRCDREPFTDIMVRKAMEMAIDRKAIANVVFGGVVTGEPVGLIAPVVKGYGTPYEEWPKDLKEEYSYNPQRAKKLLAEAGYPNGFKTNIVCSAQENMDFLQAVKSYFMDIGIDMEIKAMEQSSYMSFAMQGKMDQITLSPFAGMDSTPTFALPVRGSKHPFNYTFHNDKEYDQLVRRYLDAVDPLKAKQLAVEANMYLLKKHYFLSFFSRAFPMFWHERVKGYSAELLTFATSAGFYRARLWLDQD